MRGLFLDNLTGLVGDVFKGVANSTSRMKESVLFHKGEEEKKYKQMEERNKLIKAKEEELKTREEKAKEDDAKHKEEVARLKGEVEERNKQVPRSLVLLWLNLRTRKGVLNENEPRKVTNIVAFAKIFSD